MAVRIPHVLVRKRWKLCHSEDVAPAAVAAGAKRLLVPASAAAVAVAFLGLVDLDRAAFQILSVKLLDGALGFSARAHLDEAEAARLAGVTVGDDCDGIALTGLREEILEILVVDVETEIADE